MHDHVFTYSGICVAEFIMTWTIAGGVRFQRTYIFSFIVRGLIRRSRIKQSLDIL